MKGYRQLKNNKIMVYRNIITDEEQADVKYLVDNYGYTVVVGERDIEKIEKTNKDRKAKNIFADYSKEDCEKWCKDNKVEKLTLNIKQKNGTKKETELSIDEIFKKTEKGNLVYNIMTIKSAMTKYAEAKKK